MNAPIPPFLIGIPLYDGVDLLDVAAPCELFNWMKESVAATLAVEIRLVAPTLTPVTARGGLLLTPQATFEATPKVDLLWVPGGNADQLKLRMADRVYLDFLKTRAKDATYVTSVCEGALLLASAGLLNGFKATTHWAFLPCLRRYKKVKVVPGYPRYQVNRFKGDKGRWRYVVTGGGVSSGLDETLKLIALIAGTAVAKDVQLNTQYFPKPPVKGRIPRPTGCPLDSIP
jgi:transcriptional regulator GlxA family with amidase domain